MADPVRYKGAVKWFNPSKGFGFVTPESGGEELFVHQSSINAEGFRSLGEGEIVEFNIETGPDGRSKAVNVTGPDGAPPQGAPKRMNNPRRGLAPGMMAPGGMGGRGGYYDPNAAYGYAAPGYYMAPGYYFPQGGRGVFMGGRGGRGGRGGFVNSMAQAGSPGGAPAGQAASGLQVVVHNLPWTTTWQQLKDSFRDWKVDRADIVYDNWGRSRGFGVVRFGSKEDAEAACAKLNNTQVEGRTISVRIDRFA